MTRERPPASAQPLPADGGPAGGDTAGRDWVAIGSVNSVFGTRGWVKVFSETRPRDAIFNYAVWYLGSKGVFHPFPVVDSRIQHNSLLAALRGIDTREKAEALVGLRIAVPADSLEPPAPGEYYWRDLIGMRVVTQNGQDLGVVQGLLETGGADVLRVRGERERLIPFVAGVYVLDVDPVARCMTVDWHPDD